MSVHFQREARRTRGIAPVEQCPLVTSTTYARLSTTATTVRDKAQLIPRGLDFVDRGIGREIKHRRCRGVARDLQARGKAQTLPCSRYATRNAITLSDRLLSAEPLNAQPAKILLSMGNCVANEPIPKSR